MKTFAFVLLFTTVAVARTDFWAPLTPPRAHYSIDEKFIADPPHLEGSEVIRFRNNTDRPIGRIALQWYGEISSVRANGVALSPPPGKYTPAVFDLPADLPPGGEIELAVDFKVPMKLKPENGSAITSYLNPFLWWGFGTLDDYDVRLQVPDGYAIGTSGRFDPRSGTYRGENIRAFGLFIGKGYETAEADAGDVHVRAVFTAKGRPCAEMVMKTAVDVIGFYRQQFGVYPHRSLTIVPGMDYPAGGYPPASALVVIHGQERLADRPESFWRWITAHEIGHMYWSNYVLAQGPDSLTWLMVGLGLHADHEYLRARGITGSGLLEHDYTNGVRHGFDTTMDVTEEQEASIQWDFNNTVEHGKSIAMLNALESVLGSDTFARIYRRCLKDYAGRQLGWREFQRVSEIESGEDLGWFFEEWVRSSGSADYRVASQTCTPAAGKFDCTVRVERAGAMQMPVTIAAGFEDGSERRVRTERLADVDELKFAANSPLKSVAIEPDEAVALATAPPKDQRDAVAKIGGLPWTGAGAEALDAYQKLRDSKVDDIDTWAKLGLLLYDGKYHAEALDAMTRVAQTDSDWRFAALVWRGHLLDLLGRRQEAIASYQEALKVPGTPSMEHSQYKLIIDKQWVEERLKTPFDRKMTGG